jgi:hypothetical protein
VRPITKEAEWGIIMRFLVLGFFICCIGTNVVAQCPIQPRQASFEASRKTVTISYYNSGTRSVRGVQFLLTTENTGPSGQSVLANFDVRSILRPKQERTAVFPDVGGIAFNGSVELEIKRVSFTDLSTWTAPHGNTCKILFAEQ